ncbi:SH3 domain-containing protein [Hymenobacter actinosclerus]|uniref:SH3b domain-containing protein n=1 Tax=Hymenobacter actinosclerus TaxID=82805 RepID=A0A1I0BV80_9BACT|nr:SH3 domain-containing protein [Hymenobacter actinosclerus]SET10542.1 hypothetical protein SAMN04487998_1196 [Hymenobacter actinosclerus]
MLKKAPLFFLLLLTLAQSIQAQKVSPALQKADSLYQTGQVAGAYPWYRRARDQDGLQSGRQALRMAYTQEALGHYPAALYYLSVSQSLEPRYATWQKMVSLAQEHRLTGYPDTWRQNLLVTLQRYYYRLLQGLLLLAVLAGAALLLRRRTADRAWWIMYAGYLLSVGLALNVLAPGRVGLVARARAPLMAGPGAGATWLTTAAAGDRFEVLGRQDLWYRVRWQDREAYIRRRNLLLVE